MYPSARVEFWAQYGSAIEGFACALSLPIVQSFSCPLAVSHANGSGACVLVVALFGRRPQFS